jgi:hypothetical protein
VKNLRVVDASVFPRVPGSFAALPVYMVSEQATDTILEHIRLDDAGLDGVLDNEVLVVDSEEDGMPVDHTKYENGTRKAIEAENGNVNKRKRYH